MFILANANIITVKFCGINSVFVLLEMSDKEVINSAVTLDRNYKNYHYCFSSLGAIFAVDLLSKTYFSKITFLEKFLRHDLILGKRKSSVYVFANNALV